MNYERAHEIAKIITETIPSVKMDESSYHQQFIDLGYDSLDLSSIFLAVEEFYDVQISDEFFEALNTVAKLADHVESLVANEN